jgi:3-oxoacyl-[acyl-carrier-protein] synthase-3
VTTPVKRARILGTGHYLPERVLSNVDVEKMVDTSDEWISSRTGIKERHIAREGEATSDMAIAAAKHAIEMAGIEAKQLDMIIVATISPDMQMPSTAMFVQRAIGARSDCPGFDIAAACAGFVYNMSLADAMIRTRQAKYVLIIGAEMITRYVDWSDRNTCVLFGDGAGAAVLGPSEDGERGILSTHIYADGGQAESLWIPGGGTKYPMSHEIIDTNQHRVKMVGKDVFKFAVKAMSAAAETALTSNGMTIADVDWMIPHQANLRIIEGVVQRTGMPMERTIVNIANTANTSSASVAIALDQAVRQGKIKPGQNVLFAALGGGIAWGSALVRW